MTGLTEIFTFPVIGLIGGDICNGGSSIHGCNSHMMNSCLGSEDQQIQTQPRVYMCFVSKMWPRERMTFKERNMYSVFIANIYEQSIKKQA